jgi:hypothetical protein
MTNVEDYEFGAPRPFLPNESATGRSVWIARCFYFVLFVRTLFVFMWRLMLWHSCGRGLRPAAIRMNARHPMVPPLDKLLVSPDLQH